MRPRVGHVVWFRAKTWEGAPIQDFAAIVTRVVAEGVLDLTVFEPTAEPYRRRAVPQDLTGDTPDSWRWPVDEPATPYR